MSSWGDTAFGTYTRPVSLLLGIEVSPLVSRLTSSMEALALNEMAVAMVEAPSITVFDGFGDGSTSGDLDNQDLTPIDAGGQMVLAAPDDDDDDDFVWPTSPRPQPVSLPDILSDVQQGFACNELPPIDISLWR
ncbi:hypothetical protein SCP_0901070 [Sparassis crispa]|uniref:Uncharacterized protein n=1 Tax=Sparassis crispa TaxID=139825 RepID=A0A401GVI0_9APHY|nr:hypothetical protein SCP_0901070 [Sparassis crispa]GBE86228.1 hypothetical protein SCP_0901070 [Sparassis crispa]